jgi:hypothetical protein
MANPRILAALTAKFSDIVRPLSTKQQRQSGNSFLNLQNLIKQVSKVKVVALANSPLNVTK